MRPQRVSCGIRSGPTGGAASGSFNEAAACQLRNPAHCLLLLERDAFASMRPQRVSCGICEKGNALKGTQCGFNEAAACQLRNPGRRDRCRVDRASFNEAAACQLRNPTEEALATCDNCSFNEAAACQLRNPREFGLVGRVAGVLQ